MLKDITYKKTADTVYGTAVDDIGYTHSFRFFDGEFYPIEECNYRGGVTSTPCDDGVTEVGQDLHWPWYDSDAPRVGVVTIHYKTGAVMP